MNRADGKGGQEKTASGAVYGDRCENCGGTMNPRLRKRFCHPLCKDAYHRIAHAIGEQKMQSGGIKYAKLATSKRLQRLLKFLSDGKKHTTKEINRGADVQAVSTAIGELRRNGFNISCRLRKVKADGARIFEYQLIKHKGA